MVFGRMRPPASCATAAAGDAFARICLQIHASALRPCLPTSVSTGPRRSDNVIALIAWRARLQVRQHVDHKRTFLFLEQLILKHSAHAQCINVKESHQGIDFFFANRAHGQRFVDFLQACPLIGIARWTCSRQMFLLRSQCDAESCTQCFRRCQQQHFYFVIAGISSENTALDAVFLCRLLSLASSGTTSSWCRMTPTQPLTTISTRSLWRLCPFAKTISSVCLRR